MSSKYNCCLSNMEGELEMCGMMATSGYNDDTGVTMMVLFSIDTTLWVGTVVRDDGVDGVLSQSPRPFNGQVFHSTVVRSKFWLKSNDTRL